MEYVVIKYYGRGTWTSVNGVQVDWTDYYEECIYNNCRIKKTGKISDITTSEWNGKPIDVQKTVWDSYTVSFLARESELPQIDNIKFATQMSFVQNNNFELPIDLIDLSVASYIDITHESISNTGIHKVTINFRANKMIIDCQKGFTNNQLLISDTAIDDPDGLIFSTGLQFIPETSSEEVKDDWNQTESVAYIRNKYKYKARFYLSETEYNNLLGSLQRSKYVYYIGDAVNIAIRNILEQKQVGVDCYEVTLELIYGYGYSYPLISLSTGYKLSFKSSKTIDLDFYERDFRTPLQLIYSNTDQKIIQDEFNGVNIKNKITDKNSILMRFYLTESELVYFNKYFVKCDSLELYNLSDVIYPYTFEEANITEQKQIGFDLYQINIILVHSNNIFYPQEP